MPFKSLEDICRVLGVTPPTPEERAHQLALVDRLRAVHMQMTQTDDEWTSTLHCKCGGTFTWGPPDDKYTAWVLSHEKCYAPGGGDAPPEEIPH